LQIISSIPGCIRLLFLANYIFIGITCLAQEKGSIDVLPCLQFVREGRSVILKARSNDKKISRGWQWAIIEPDQGVLEVIDFNRVRFTATNALPWARVHIRATNLDAPEKSGEAVVEVINSPVFETIENILGEDWISKHVDPKETIKVMVKGPSVFSWRDKYTIYAEIDSFEEDRFYWEISPNIGTIQRVKTTISCREKIKFIPTTGRTETISVHVSVRNIENPDKCVYKFFDILPDKNNNSSGSIPVLVPGIFGVHVFFPMH
jgi:hypothetical protein